MKINKFIYIALVVVLMAFTTSCKKEVEIESETKTDIIDLCFVARGTNGELIDLHILKNENNQAIITTSPSEEKGTNTDIPEYIIIAGSVQFADNYFTLPETNSNYWIFEISLEDPIYQKSNGPGSGATITAHCNCLAGSGDCYITYKCLPENPQVFTALCKTKPENNCGGDIGLSQCAWTLPEIIIRDKYLEDNKTTTLIIESTSLIVNELQY